MEFDYNNTEIDSLNLPTTITLSGDSEKILNALKDSDIKFIAKGDDKKLDITFDIDDIEKINKLLQPFGINKQLENFDLKFPNVEKKEKLIPIANTMASLYQRKINSRVNRAESHKKHIGLLSADITKAKDTIQLLSDRNGMLKKISTSVAVLKNPINALIKRNELKIDRLSKNIPKLEKQIQIHNNTIDKLNKAAEHYEIRKNVCKHFSDTVRSFFILDKTERNKSYLSSLSSMNTEIQKLNNEKINNCTSAIAKISSDFQSMSHTEKEKAQNRLNSLNATRSSLVAKNKVLQAALPDISELSNKSNSPQTTAIVDKAESIFDKNVSEKISFDNTVNDMILSNTYVISKTAVELSQNEVSLIGRVNDRDNDGIPDKLDSSFSPNENETVQEINEIPPDAKKIAVIIDEHKDGDMLWNDKTAFYKTENGQFLSEFKDGWFGKITIQEITADEIITQVENARMNKHGIIGGSMISSDGFRILSDYSAEDKQMLLSAADKSSFGNNEIHLVTDDQLSELKKSGITVKVNRKDVAEDGKIPIMISANDNSKLKEIIMNSNSTKKKTL